MRGVHENPPQQHNCGFTTKGCSSSGGKQRGRCRSRPCLDTPNGLVRLFEQYMQPGQIDRGEGWQRRRDKCPDSLTLMLLGNIASKAG